jgi:non-specific serine/threonine protein kinase
MLETIREFGLEQLAAAGEEVATRRAHLGAFTELAGASAAGIHGQDQRIWLDRLEADHDNLRAALNWAMANGEREQALRLAGSLWRFWVIRGHLHEGRDLLERVLGSVSAVELPASAPLALARSAAGALAESQGDYDAAITHHEASLAVSRALGDRQGIASSLNNLGNIAHDRSDYDAARRYHGESLAISREIDDTRGIARSLANIGVTALYEGRWDDSAEALEACLRLLEQLGDRHAQGIVINNLGVLASRRGDWPEAIRCNEESLALRREINDPIGIGSALVNLAEARLALAELDAVAPLLDESEALFRAGGDRRALAVVLHNRGQYHFARGDDPAAVAAYAESGALLREVGDRAGLADTLEGLAELAAAQGQPDQLTLAVRTFGAAATVRTALGAAPPDPDRSAIEAALASARAQLGRAAYDRAWTVGERQSAEDALAAALAVVLVPGRPSVAKAAARHPQGAAPGAATLAAAEPVGTNPAGLTARELEVLRLLAAGRSTDEIAETLFISRRTATTHVGNILGKIGVGTRAAAVAYAYQHGIIGVESRET